MDESLEMQVKALAAKHGVPENMVLICVEVGTAVRNETIEEVRANIEKAAKGHDDLATRYPNGPDKIKAAALRRFAEVFL